MIGDKENRGQLTRAQYDALPTPEIVNHSSHYGGKDNIYEVVKVMEAWLTPKSSGVL
jgi:hypothetical protein